MEEQDLLLDMKSVMESINGHKKQLLPLDETKDYSVLLINWKLLLILRLVEHTTMDW